MSHRHIRRGIVASIALPNVDTDTIIPIEYCINRERPNFDVGLFRHWRFDEHDQPREDFVLNREPTARASMLVTGPNFGCGSSREMAVWALADYGFEVLIGASFGEIFYNNCFLNNVLAAVVSPSDAKLLQDFIGNVGTTELIVDIRESSIAAVGLPNIAFELDDLRAEMLIERLDPIAATLTRRQAIEDFEQRDRIARPWVQMSSTDTTR